MSKNTFNLLCKIENGVTIDKYQLKHEIQTTGDRSSKAFTQMLSNPKHEVVLMHPEDYEMLRQKGYVR